MLKYLLNLQLFGEGGDGGDGGSASPAGEGLGNGSGENIELASIPEKARKIYKQAVEETAGKQQKASTNVTQPEAKTTEAKLSYQDLIKSDEYKEQHKAYMEKTIGDRLKNYKGMEEGYNKALSALEVVASKYGINPNDENFLETLKEKIEADDSYYENYAMEHDISTEEARRIVSMERQVAQIEAQKRQAEQQEQMRQQIMLLQQNAEKTKAQFPEFDLELEMQDEKFRRLCAVSNGDTTSAYMACHWDQIIPARVQMASQQIRNQTAQAVASNMNRPIENGVQNVAPSVVTQDFSNMNLQQIREYADSQRRLKGR